MQKLIWPILIIERLVSMPVLCWKSFIGKFNCTMYSRYLVFLFITKRNATRSFVIWMCTKHQCSHCLASTPTFIRYMLFTSFVRRNFVYGWLVNYKNDANAGTLYLFTIGIPESDVTVSCVLCYKKINSIQNIRKYY